MVLVQADLFRHSHEKYQAAILYKHSKQKTGKKCPWSILSMTTGRLLFWCNVLDTMNTSHSMDYRTPRHSHPNLKFLKYRWTLNTLVLGLVRNVAKSQGTDPNKVPLGKTVKPTRLYSWFRFWYYLFGPHPPLSESPGKGANNALKAKKASLAPLMLSEITWEGAFSVDQSLAPWKTLSIL